MEERERVGVSSEGCDDLPEVYVMLVKAGDDDAGVKELGFMHSWEKSIISYRSGTFIGMRYRYTAAGFDSLRELFNSMCKLFTACGMPKLLLHG